MEPTAPFYLNKIKEDLSLRQRENPLYSLRAYARDLGVHPSTMSQILKGNRPLPMKTSTQVMNKLRLGPKERTLFMESLMKIKTNIDEIDISQIDEDRFMLDESYYKVIAEWEHYALLDLFELKDFTPTLSEFSERLGITPNRAEVVVNNLMVSGLLIHKEGRFAKVHKDVRTTEDMPGQALNDSHIETMKMGIEKIGKIEKELRDFSSATVAIDLEKLPEAKLIIREFRKKMAALLRDGNKTDVYQLAIQFYPLTKTKEEKH